MYENLKGVTDSSEIKAAVSKILDECQAGLDITMENQTRIALLEEYIDYLVDKKTSLFDTKKAVTKTLNTMIEKFNCGNPELISSIEKYLTQKYVSKNKTQQLALRIGKKLNKVNTKFMTNDLVRTVESVQEKVPSENVFGVGLTYFEKYGEKLLICFPDDFSKQF